MSTDAFQRKEVSRERVMGLTLVDVFLQFIFLLLGLLLYMYVDDYSPEKWEKFARSGKSVFQGEFSETWAELPEKYDNLRKDYDNLRKDAANMKKENEAVKIYLAANAPGKEACLEPKEKKTISAKFSYTKTGIQFKGFTREYISYISSKHPSLVAEIVNLDKKAGTIFSINEFERTFNVMSVASCQHFFERDEGQVKSWMKDGESFSQFQKMREAIARINK